MNSWNVWTAARAFADQVTETDGAAADQGDGEAAPDPSAAAPSDDEEPDYSFEGYSVEFLDKVGMMPIVPKPAPATQDPS